MNEKITTEDLLAGKVIAAELEAAKARVEAKAAQFELHIAYISRKYKIDDGDSMTEDGTLVRVKKPEAPAIEPVK